MVGWGKKRVDGQLCFVLEGKYHEFDMKDINKISVNILGI